MRADRLIDCSGAAAHSLYPQCIAANLSLSEYSRNGTRQPPVGWGAGHSSGHFRPRPLPSAKPSLRRAQGSMCSQRFKGAVRDSGERVVDISAHHPIKLHHSLFVLLLIGWNCVWLSFSLCHYLCFPFTEPGLCTCTVFFS